MDRIRIVGGNELTGIIPISGAKNAALPLMIASLLTDDTLTLENVPHLADVEQLIRILGNHGVDYSVNGRRESQNEGYSRTINFSARNIVDTTAPYELVSKMRASLLGDRAAAGPHGRGQGVAARRLRHRHAPGRPVHRRPAGARRRDRRRQRLCHRQGPEGRLDRQPLRLPEGLGRRHPCADDGGHRWPRARRCSKTPPASRKSSISPNA